MALRRPLALLFALGLFGWPVGLVFGGVDSDRGSTIIFVGSVLILGSLALEWVLSARDRRRTR